MCLPAAPRRSGAGGGLFGAGVFFSGGGAPWGTASTRAACWSSRPGVALEILWFPSDLQWRRIGRPDPGGARVLQLLLRRIRRRLGLGGVAGPGGRPPWPFIDRSSAAARRAVKAASFEGQITPRQWQDGGCCSSSPSPVKLVFFELALAPLPRICSSFAFFYVLCMWIPGEYTW